MLERDSQNEIRANRPPAAEAADVQVAAPAGGIRATLVSAGNLLLPLLGMYGGQYLIVALERIRYWGMAIVALSLVLLLLRLRPRRWDRAANIVQIALGFFVSLPLALNAGNMKFEIPSWASIALWAFSILLVSLTALTFKPRPINLGIGPLPRFDRWDWLVLVLLIAGATLLRVWNIETIPPGVDPDEGSLAISAADAAFGAFKDPFATGWVTHPTLQFFFNGVFVRLFGRSFLAMRLPIALMGILAVAAIYIFARAGYGRRVAILAGLLAMGSDVAIQYSRLGINNNADLFFMAWTLAALWIAGASGRPIAYVLAGLGLGLGQYYYFGGRAIPFVVAANVFVWLIADWRGVLRAWYLLVGGLLVALVVLEPLIGHWLRFPHGFTDHLDLTVFFSKYMVEKAARLHVTQAQIIWEHVRDSLLVFTVIPDRGTFYHPAQPLLHPAQAPIFLVGVLTALLGVRKAINQGLVLWIGVVLTLGSVLMTDPAAFHRILGLVPAVIVLVAIGLDAAVSTLAQAVPWPGKMPAWPSWATTGLTALAVTMLVAVNLNFYFRIYNNTDPYKPPTQEGISQVALDYERLGGQGQFLLCTRELVDASGKVYHTIIEYVAPGKMVGCIPQNLAKVTSVRPLYFYVLPDQVALLPELQARFPGGTLYEFHRAMDGLVLWTRYSVATE